MKEITHVSLVRHGETKANVESIFHGATNTSLTPKGVNQANQIAERLARMRPNASAIYSSPLDRALQTAYVIGQKLNLEIHMDDSLREINLGEWEGLTFEELQHKYRLWDRVREDPDFTSPGGESLRELGFRTSKALRRMVRHHLFENIIVVGHGGAFCSALSVLLGTKPLLGEEYYMENGAVTELIFDPGPRLINLNTIFHLEKNG